MQAYVGRFVRLFQVVSLTNDVATALNSLDQSGKDIARVLEEGTDGQW
jgi:hypothetical protein